MRKELLLAATLLLAPTGAVWAQAPSHQHHDAGTPSQASVDSQSTDSQARAAKPGTVTSPNPGNAAIAKIDAAGKNPNPGPRNAPLSEPGGPATGENNNGGR